MFNGKVGHVKKEREEDKRKDSGDREFQKLADK